MTQIIQEAVSKFKPDAEVMQISPLSGGSINRSFRVETSQGTFFAKLNARDRFPGMFEAESRGLQLLREKSSFRVPRPFSVCNDGSEAVLLMEYLAPGRPGPGFWDDFGKKLARMHRESQSSFGLDHSNYIGSLPQENPATGNWIDFFADHRLRAQLRPALSAGLLQAEDERRFDHLFERLPEFFPEEPPALLHGDLWSGNYLCTSGGDPAIIDPAVYFGHRLMDIGMSRLFGGFDPGMYEAYNDHYPMSSNWRDGAEVANLYPLLVHVNLFGASYVPQVRSILSRYS